MRKLSGSGNMISRQSKLRRLFYYFFLLTVFIYGFVRTRRYYYDNNSSSTTSLSSLEPAVPHNKYINRDGSFLSFEGYRILQHVINPLHQTFTDLYYFLDQDNELKLYYKFIPVDSYHVVVADLRDRSSLTEENIKSLNDEQELLDDDPREATCSGKQILIVNKQELRLEIQFPDDYLETRLNGLQKRWKEKFSPILVHQYTSFYITLAIQYRDFPTQDIFNEVNRTLNDWHFWPVDIELDPVEICSYTNPVSYAPIWPPTMQL